MLYPYFLFMAQCRNQAYTGLEFENKAVKFSGLFFLCSVSFFLGSQSLHLEMKWETFLGSLYLSSDHFS